MLFSFLTGLILGILCLGLFYFKSYKKRVNLEAANQKILEEKRIIVNFIHNLSEAIQANISKKALFEMILHTATISTGASSGCIYEVREEHLASIAIEGLFPPQNPDIKEAKEADYSKTSFIKELLEKEVLSFQDGLIPKVAKTGEALFIPYAEKVTCIPRYSDPLLKIHSLMVVPIKTNNKSLGVIAVCNPIQYPHFKKIDFSLVQSLADQAASRLTRFL